MSRPRRSPGHSPGRSALARAGTLAGHGYVVILTGGVWLLVLVPFIFTRAGRRRIAWPLWGFVGAALIWLALVVYDDRPLDTEASLPLAAATTTEQQQPPASSETRQPSMQPPAAEVRSSAQAPPATTPEQRAAAAGALDLHAAASLRVAHAEIVEESGAAAAAIAACWRPGRSVEAAKSCAREAYAGFVRDKRFAADTANALASAATGRCRAALTKYGRSLRRYSAVVERASVAASGGDVAELDAALERRMPEFRRYVTAASDAFAACRMR